MVSKCNFFSIQALLLDDKWILFFQVLFFIYNTTTIIIWLSMKINGEGVLKNQTNRSKKKQRGLLFTYINHQLEGPTHTFSLQLDRWLGLGTNLLMSCMGDLIFLRLKNNCENPSFGFCFLKAKRKRISFVSAHHISLQ